MTRSAMKQAALSVVWILNLDCLHEFTFTAVVFLTLIKVDTEIS